MFEKHINSPIKNCLAKVGVVVAKRLLLHTAAARQLLGPTQEKRKAPAPAMGLLGSLPAILPSVIQAVPCHAARVSAMHKI